MVSKRILNSLGREYRRCIEKGCSAFDRIEGKRPTNKNAWVGRHAEQLWLTKVLPAHTGIVKRTVVTDPLSEVSNLGDPRRTDAFATLISGESAQFELKKSDYGGRRVKNQLAATLFDLGLGTYGAESLNVIYAENGRIDVYTKGQGEQVVRTALEGGSVEIPAPAKQIDFAPNSVAGQSAVSAFSKRGSSDT